MLRVHQIVLTLDDALHVDEALLRSLCAQKLRVPENLVRVVGAVALVILTAISITYTATNGYNPFIYFNF